MARNEEEEEQYTTKHNNDYLKDYASVKQQTQNSNQHKLKIVRKVDYFNVMSVYAKGVGSLQ